jgi:hypothetical protein
MLNKELCKQCIIALTGKLCGWTHCDEENWEHELVHCPRGLSSSFIVSINEPPPIECAYRIEQLYAE